MKKENIKTEMFRVIESWLESNLPQKEFCIREKIVYHTFKYWHKKYKIEKGRFRPNATNSSNSEFIPVEISSLSKPILCNDVQIEVVFPSGVQLSCPASMDIQKLKTLIGV